MMGVGAPHQCSRADYRLLRGISTGLFRSVQSILLNDDLEGFVVNLGDDMTQMWRATQTALCACVSVKMTGHKYSGSQWLSDELLLRGGCHPSMDGCTPGQTIKGE